MVEPLPFPLQKPPDREDLLKAMSEILARLDRAQLFQAGAHMSMAIHCVTKAPIDKPAPDSRSR